MSPEPFQMIMPPLQRGRFSRSFVSPPPMSPWPPIMVMPLPAMVPPVQVNMVGTVTS